MTYCRYMRKEIEPTSNYYVPYGETLNGETLVNTNLQQIDSRIQESIISLLNQESYPCIAAIRSFKKQDYRVGVYSNLGTGDDSPSLAQDLYVFVQEQQKSRSPYLTFWAVFSKTPEVSESEFEMRMWRELSYLTNDFATEGLPKDLTAGSTASLITGLTTDKHSRVEWDSKFSSDPLSKNFCFSFAGHAMFIVGMHSQSSRRARQFPYATIVVNLYSQFEQLALQKKYEPMKVANRLRDIKFQGNINPMVEKYNDDWEPIQFSGKNNPPEWKCPFQFGLKPGLPNAT